MSTEATVTQRIKHRLFDEGDDYFYIVGIIGGLVIWEIAGNLMPPLLFESFSDTVILWIGYMMDGTIIDAVLVSLRHAVVGFVLAVLIGIPLGFMMGRDQRVYWALDGPLNALYATPLVAIIPLLAVWFGLGLAAKIVVVFLMAFIELTVNVFQGVRDVSDQYDVVAESFEASRLETYRMVLIPAIMPFLFAGLRLAVGRAVRGMIVAEIFLAVEGIGELLILPQYRFRVGTQLAFIGTITLIGIIAQSSVKEINKRVVHWPAEVGRG